MPRVKKKRIRKKLRRFGRKKHKKKRIDRVFGLINSGDWIIQKKWMAKNRYGLCDYATHTISLNISAWIVRLLIHEIIHALNEDGDCEQQTEMLESEWMARLTITEIEALAEYLLSL